MHYLSSSSIDSSASQNLAGMVLSKLLMLSIGAAGCETKRRILRCMICLQIVKVMQKSSAEDMVEIITNSAKFSFSILQNSYKLQEMLTWLAWELGLSALSSMTNLINSPSLFILQGKMTYFATTHCLSFILKECSSSALWGLSDPSSFQKSICAKKRVSGWAWTGQRKIWTQRRVDSLKGIKKYLIDVVRFAVNWSDWSYVASLSQVLSRKIQGQSQYGFQSWVLHNPPFEQAHSVLIGGLEVQITARMRNANRKCIYYQQKKK